MPCVRSLASRFATTHLWLARAGGRTPRARAHIRLVCGVRHGLSRSLAASPSAPVGRRGVPRYALLAARSAGMARAPALAPTRANGHAPICPPHSPLASRFPLRLGGGRKSAERAAAYCRNSPQTQLTPHATHTSKNETHNHNQTSAIAPLGGDYPPGEKTTCNPHRSQI